MRGRRGAGGGRRDAHGVIGLASLGAARDSGLGFDGEIYTLYVDPAFLGAAPARALLHGAFEALEGTQIPLLPGLGSCPQQCLFLL